MILKPILFSGPMVRAILDGRKTQTRRIVKPQPDSNHAYTRVVRVGWWFHIEADKPDPVMHTVKCPYGQPGDGLWVKETFCMYPMAGNDGAAGPVPREGSGVTDAMLKSMNRKWKPSIFMRREYSRISLEITGIRVERLQDISEEDAWAEGVSAKDHNCGRVGYKDLWESINGPGSWDANPWVWVVEFKRMEGGNAS